LRISVTGGSRASIVFNTRNRWPSGGDAVVGQGLGGEERPASDISLVVPQRTGTR
jgi:hypothetical protein